MTARVLVVDDMPANVKLLEARLSAEYFDVITAYNGRDALAVCERAECDIVLLDVMMPDMDGFEVCRRLKSNPATHHIPVVMVTALDQPSDRVRGLEAGADDFLTKPVTDVALMSRVRSLARLKMVTDELRMRAVTSQGNRHREPGARGGRRDRPQRPRADRRRPRLVLRAHRRRRLSAEHTVEVETNPSEALFHAAEGNYDLVIVSLGLQNFDGLRLCSQLRSLERTRNVPILAVAEADNNARLVRGLEIGVNDYLMRPIDKNEMLARARTQIKKKRYTERLRDNVQMSIEMAITDALTGLFNRRYMETHLATLVEQAADARQADRGADPRHRLLQVDQRRPRPRRRRRRVARVRAAHAQGDPQHRSCLPLRRRGIRHRDAGNRHGGRHHGGRAAAPAASPTSRSRSSRACGSLDVTISIGIAALGEPDRHRRGHAQARRPGALPRQARRPQPRGAGRGVNAVRVGRHICGRACPGHRDL